MAAGPSPAPVGCRYRIFDSHFERSLIREASVSWPGLSHPAWHRYDSLLERKWAMHYWSAIPEPCQRLLGQMSVLPIHQHLIDSSLLRAVPDLMLWGAGLHCMGPGDHLDIHLDADRHPRLGLERRANAILFLDDWPDEWGGHLEFWREDLTGPAVRIKPITGRMVLFETSDQSYHGIPQPIHCPEGVLRKTLALYWWSAPRGLSKRPRAQFVRTAREPWDAAKEQLRRERAA